MTDILLPETRRAAAPAAPSEPALVRRARVLNLVGLVTPLANLGMRLLAPPELRWFGVGAGVLLCGAAAWAWFTHRPVFALVALAVHAGLVLAGLVHPRLPEVAGRAWIAFGRTLGRWMTWPIFAALYLLVVTPTALLVRLLGKDPLARRAPPAESYWTPRRPSPRERLERQF